MTTHADLAEVSDHRIVADWALGEWADRLLEQVGLGVTIVDRHGTVMYSDIATVAPDVIGADSERGGVSGEAIVCARWQFGAAGANIAVVIGNSMPVSGSGSMVPALPAAGTRRWPTTFRPPRYCPKEVHTEYAARALP